METVEILQEIIPLLTGLAGLVSTGVAAYFAVMNFIKNFKGKKATEIWNLVMTIADAAMTEAERAAKEGLITKDAKKQMVIDSVKAGLVAAGLDITDFIDQLSSYIDDTIKFTNGMQKAKENKE